MAKVWQTVTEACQTLGVSQRTLYRRIKSGDIESKVENKRRYVLVTVAEVDLPEADTVASSELVEELRARVEQLSQQLQVKDKEIDELHQLLMTEKRQAQLLLEYKQPFWRRWFGQRREGEKR